MENTPEQQALLNRHAALLREHAQTHSLVSAGDLAQLEARHTADSLALAPLLASCAPQGGLHLDIGSGGGFPAIPLAIVYPGRPFLLLERSEKKAEFLRLLVRELGLGNVHVLTGEFPVALRTPPPGVAAWPPVTVTARAVERPERLWPRILRWLPAGATFLCQFPGPEPKLPPGMALLPLPALPAPPRGALRLYQHLG